jgi:hypothetical protein
MGNYEIKVKIEIVECPDSGAKGECIENNGTHTMTIGEKKAESIDECESSVLATAHPAIREALANHLEGLSKKKAPKKRRMAKE